VYKKIQVNKMWANNFKSQFSGWELAK
jgi:hypothetical protein